MNVFVSYSSETTDDPFVKLFCTRLDQALARTIGDKSQRHVWGDHVLREGDQWQQQLSSHINEAQVLVPLYSPLFFASQACGKELGLFASRLGVAAATEPAAAWPITPVWWHPRLEHPDHDAPSAPECGLPGIDGLQHRSRDGSLHGQHSYKDVARRGLHYYIRNATSPEFSPVVDAYFDDLALRIKALAQDWHGRLPAAALDFAQAPDLWAASRSASAAAGGAGAAVGDASAPRVSFLVIAAKPPEIELLPEVGPALRQAYLAQGGGDWQPFYPEQGNIVGWLQRIVHRIDSDVVTTVQVDTVDSVAAVLRQAQICSNGSWPLFLVVDAWTAQLQRYAEILENIARATVPFCVVVVPFTRRHERPDLVEAMHSLLASREVLDDELCQTYVAGTPKELERQVAELCEKLRLRFRKLRDRRGSPRTPFANGLNPKLVSPGARGGE